MRGPRVYPPLLVGVAMILGGCGVSPEGPTLAPPATPRTIELGWVERDKNARFTFHVAQLVVAEHGWRATVSVTNRSKIAYRLEQRPVGLVLPARENPA